jgi:hypothetical protein
MDPWRQFSREAHAFSFLHAYQSPREILSGGEFVLLHYRRPEGGIWKTPTQLSADIRHPPRIKISLGYHVNGVSTCCRYMPERCRRCSKIENLESKTLPRPLLAFTDIHCILPLGEWFFRNILKVFTVLEKLTDNVRTSNDLIVPAVVMTGYRL